MTSGIPGSGYDPHPDTAHRLERWRHLAAQGLTRGEIAAKLGIRRATLDQLVCRARRAGHPDAIRHPDAVDTGAPPMPTPPHRPGVHVTQQKPISRLNPQKPKMSGGDQRRTLCKICRASVLIGEPAVWLTTPMGMSHQRCADRVLLQEVDGG